MAQREEETVMLDRNVGLAQELNLSGPEREMEERAESGRMGPAERKRERIPEPEETGPPGGGSPPAGNGALFPFPMVRAADGSGRTAAAGKAAGGS